MEIKKILIAALAIIILVIVWNGTRDDSPYVYYDASRQAIALNTNQEKETLTIRPGKSSTFPGVPYTCENGNLIYVNATGDSVEMTLVYPDDAFGKALFSEGSKSGKTFVFDDGENRLAYSETEATFEINNITVADTCTRK